MSFGDELDDVRVEVARGATGIVRWWPKVVGVGNVLLTEAPTATVYTSTGSSAGSASVALVTVDGVTRVDATVNAGGIDYSSDNSVRFDWTYGGSAQNPAWRFFDVVRAPYTIELSLNDLVDELADVGQRLARLATTQASGRTKEQLASSHAWKAWGELRSWLLKLCEQRDVDYPRAVITQEELRRVHVVLAVARVLRSEGEAPESPTGRLAAELERKAQELFAAMPSLRLAAEDQPTEAVRVGTSRAVRLRRGW